MPAIESFGFETHLRLHTSGQAMCLRQFDNLAVVPRDPFDQTINFQPLEPVETQHLGREFMIKTRRRDGLHEEVSAFKYLDDGLLPLLR